MTVCPSKLQAKSQSYVSGDTGVGIKRVDDIDYDSFVGLMGRRSVAQPNRELSLLQHSPLACLRLWSRQHATVICALSQCNKLLFCHLLQDTWIKSSLLFWGWGQVSNVSSTDSNPFNVSHDTSHWPLLNGFSVVCSTSIQKSHFPL